MHYLFLCYAYLLPLALFTNAKEALSESFKEASMTHHESRLTVSTGRFKRSWQWSPRGWSSGVTGAHGRSSEADWQIPGVTGPATLVSVVAHQGNDQGFTSEHLKIVSTIHYPEANIMLQHTIWAYPLAPGLRTQVSLKTTGQERLQSTKVESRSESLPLPKPATHFHAYGYYSDTQNRNRDDTPIYKLHSHSSDEFSNNWASVLVVSSNQQHLALVKESHKCINTEHGGARTGQFQWNADRLTSTGIGWDPADFTHERYRDCWAHWIIEAEGDFDQLALAIKVFDRLRYPIDPKRDIYIMANTWGSTTHKRDAQIQAREDNVLIEIESQADLGIDVQQIDDGWQGFGYDHWRPISSNTLRTRDEAYPYYQADSYPVYPQGWHKVKALAKKKKLKLGLWAAHSIPTKDLIWNYDHGNFLYYKIDFARLHTMQQVDELTQRARSLILHSRHQARINWDVTEKSPRVGYFYARDLGNIYLENRKPNRPASVVYHPHLVLRDAWHVSQLLNLNKFQITVQNVDLVNKKVSDAYKYPHDYVVAQTLMGSPIFFQETQYYSPQARQEIRQLLATYKSHRKEMYKGYIFPIGDTPSQSQWSGFQCHTPNKSTGYLTLFRPIQALTSEQAIDLKFHPSGSEFTFENLLTGEKWTALLDDKKHIKFTIPQPAGFLFLRYQVNNR